MIQGHPVPGRYGAPLLNSSAKHRNDEDVSRETFTHNLWQALITGVLPGF